jgi:hypothetical protein
MAGGTKGKVGGAVLHGEARGRRRSKEYATWISMRQRCRDHAHYRAHGVTVCERWNHSFAAFLLDVGRAPSTTHTLDRWPDAAGNYEPGNVRWATKVEQRRNRRSDARIGRPWLGRKRQIPQGPDGRFLPRSSDGDYQAIR